MNTRTISFEIRLTAVTLAFTLAATALFLRDMALSTAISSARHWLELAAFTLITAFLIYGNVGYQLTRIGHLQRRCHLMPFGVSETRNDMRPSPSSSSARRGRPPRR